MHSDPPLERLLTEDGSFTLLRTDLGETYHSKHGALTESKHVFIDAGLEQCAGKDPLAIFEVGFGTGLNAWLSALWAIKNKITIYYHGIETIPLSPELCPCPSIILEEIALWDQIQEAKWDEPVVLNEYFNLHKNQLNVFEMTPQLNSCSLIYFDAFAPRFQPEIWTLDIFRKMHSMLEEQGILVTYCSKGDVRRNMLEAGFKVAKLNGPPGKTHMLRALKIQGQ